MHLSGSHLLVRKQRVKELVGNDKMLGESVDAVDVEFTLN